MFGRPACRRSVSADFRHTAAAVIEVGGYAKLEDSEERAIVPGKPEESPIWKYFVSSDPKEVMISALPPDYCDSI